MGRNYMTQAMRAKLQTCTAWTDNIDNIKAWTGLLAEESIRMTDDRAKWRKRVRGVADPRIEDG